MDFILFAIIGLVWAMGIYTAMQGAGDTQSFNDRINVRENN